MEVYNLIETDPRGLLALPSKYPSLSILPSKISGWYLLTPDRAYASCTKGGPPPKCGAHENLKSHSQSRHGQTRGRKDEGQKYRRVCLVFKLEFTYQRQTRSSLTSYHRCCAGAADWETYRAS